MSAGGLSVKLLALSIFTAVLLSAGEGEFRVASFRSDVTPAIGEPLIWVTPTAKVEDPLWAKGVVIEANGKRFVLCAVDWCGLSNSTYLMFSRKIARAARTELSRVAVHVVHQHTAPYIDSDAEKLLGQLPEPPLLMSAAFLEDVTDRLAVAVDQAIGRLRGFDQVGMGEARVERVASARRILKNGKLITRFSGGGRDPKLAALPEGAIDPFVRTVTFAAGETPLVRLHYYATHPQTFCCDGRVSGDFAGAAREAVEARDKVPQVYFTGCSGDVTAGKYNDGTVEARQQLARRLQQGMEAAIAATRLEPVGDIRWRTAELRLAPPAGEGRTPEERRAVLSTPKGRTGAELYRAAVALAFAERERPLEVKLLEIGPVSILHLPGEPMLEFERYARQLLPERFVPVAGYGDISPGYLCTDEALEQGGYEPSASRSGPGTEARLKRVIRELLGRKNAER
ncbi:MAG: hypothetical protein GY953_16440 [bacterium]|nr:hypothetical protein [bacterium]